MLVNLTKTTFPQRSTTPKSVEPERINLRAVLISVIAVIIAWSVSELKFYNQMLHLHMGLVVLIEYIHQF